MASKSKKRRRVLGASCILAALIIAGSSFAWFTSKDEVTNRLTASSDYGVSIVESFVPPKQWVPGQTINKDVYAVNTGNIEAFVKESISGNLSYTYEKRVSAAPENGIDTNGVAKDAGYVRLDTDSVRLIDGATTMEAGGFIAWTNATKTIYKLDGTEVETGTGTNKIEELTTAITAKIDGTGDDVTFKYQYSDGTNTYIATDLKENAVFYKYDNTDALSTDTKTLTVDHSPTAGTVNSATQTDANDAANAPGKVEGERWHPTDTGVYIFRRSYVPNNAADADQNAVTYKFGTTKVEESAFKTQNGDWTVTDTSTSTDKTFKYKYTDGSSNVYYGDDLKNDTVFYKANTAATPNTINSGSTAEGDKLTLTREQEGYFTYAGYYYVADDTDPVKNEGKYYKIVLGNDDFRAIETDGTGTDKTYIFDVSATQYQLGYPDTIEVDPVTGKIASDSSVAYSFVKEEKVENVTPDLYYHATGGGENGDVAYLQAVYSAKDADGTGNYAQKAAIAAAAANAADQARHDYLDAQGAQAAAEATYDNAVGAYNSAKSRYDQAYADWKYAEALSAASKDLIDAAAKRGQAQNEFDQAKDKFDAAYEAVKQVAKDMKGGTDGTRPTTATAPETSKTDYKDLLNFADSDSSSTRTDISYKSIFQTALTANATNTNIDTLEEVIESTASEPINGTMYNFNNTQYELLRDANAYMNAMKTLWDDTNSTSGTPATTASIVGASKELWEALDDFKTLTKDDPNGADVVAAQKLARVEAARKNMKSLLEDYKYLFEGLHTADFSESTLTALVAGGNDFTTQIDAWIDRLTDMGDQMAANTPVATAGNLVYDANHHVDGDDVTTKNHGANIIVADFIEKYKDYVKENADDLPKAENAWQTAVNNYNKAVSATETGGAKKVYTDRIQTQQKKEDPLHSDATTKVYEKNDYEGLTSNGTTTATAADDNWWLKNNNDVLVKTYAVMRPEDGNPSIGGTYFVSEGVLNDDGKKLWQTIGKEGVTDTEPNYLAMPTSSAEGVSNYTYYGYPDGTDVATLTGTKDAEYSNTAYTYKKAIIAVTKEDADDDGSEWTSLVQNTRLTTPAYQTVAALKTAMDNAKTPADNATNDYSQAIATTAAAKKDSERAATVSAGAQDAANAAMAADESAIKINILLDDAAENLDWTSALADGDSAQVADFYYNYILGAGETSEKLIDAVELDKSLTARDYKELVFDLNVKLDSAQVTYDNDQRTITTTAVEANDEFKMNPTVGRESTDGKGVAVTWDGSKSVSPTTTYRVGTNPVTPKKVDAKNVTGQTGANEGLNGNYIYEIDVAGTKYYGKSLADGTKFYSFGAGGDTFDANTSVTLNVVQ